METKSTSGQEDSPQAYDVAVIGYGPTGLVAASMLAQAGRRVVVIERWPTMYGLPRLTHIDGETARIIQACGDVTRALRDASPIETYHYRNAAGELLMEINWNERQCGYPHFSIYQPDIEDAIHERVAQHANVELFRGWAAVALEQGSDDVSITIQRTNGVRDDQWTERPRQFKAKYVLGSDGANSFVRRALGIERTDYGVNERWLNLDSENKGEGGDPFKLLTIFCDPARGHMYMPIGSKRTRFELRVLPSEETAFWEDQNNGWTWLEKKHGLKRDDFKVLRNVVYTFETRMANRWRDGRVLLGGDAAHSMMPYMGQGACSGMRDGINLAWKLDLVLSGRCSPELLDAYEQERRPHVGQIMEMSLFLGKLTNEDDPDKAAARDEAFRTGNVPPMPPFPKIENGVVHREPDGCLLACAGIPGPQPRVRQGSVEGLLDDVVGRGFLLVTTQDPVPFIRQEQKEFLGQLGCRIVVISPDSDAGVVELDGEISSFMHTHGICAYIGRPDFVVFGSVGRLEALAELVDDLRVKLHWIEQSKDGVTVGRLQWVS